MRLISPLLRLVASTPALYALMLWPGAHIIADLFWQEWLYSQMMHETGVISVQFLTLSLAVTPALLILGKIPAVHGVGRWLLKHRRDFGIACFIYACLHLAHYIRELSALSDIFFDLRFLDIVLGWLGFSILLALAVTSTARAKARLGRGWKRLHQLTYLGAVLIIWHWLLFDFFPDQALFWAALMLALKLLQIGLRHWRMQSRRKARRPG